MAISLGSLVAIIQISVRTWVSNPLLAFPVSYSALTFAPKITETKEIATVRRLHQLFVLNSGQIASIDIALMNLLCAQGLPGSDGMDIEKELAVLDRWAAVIKSETDRNLHNFYENPASYENSLGYFKTLMLITVLQQDFDVQYNLDRIYKPDFTDCRDVFLHGLTRGSTDEKHGGGTCVSMPVLYVAVVRRLGYPVKLVTTREHIFARWEDEQDRFNIEATGNGLNTYPDEYYATWPNKLTQEEISSGAYLQSLTPAQELGVFMAARGYVLQDIGKDREAIVAYAYAHMLDPISIDSFDNLGRSVMGELDAYPAVKNRPSFGQTGESKSSSRKP